MKLLWFRDDDLTDTSLTEFLRVATVLERFGFKPTVSVIPLLTSRATITKLVDLGFEIAIHGFTHVSDSSGRRELEKNYLTTYDVENFRKYVSWHKNCGIDDGALFVPPGNIISNKWLEILTSFYNFRISDHLLSDNRITEAPRIPVFVDVTRWQAEQVLADPLAVEAQMRRSACVLSALGARENYIGIGIHHKRIVNQLQKFECFIRENALSYEPTSSSHDCKLGFF